MEQELEPVVRHLVEQRWPFRLHATYNESISRMLDVFEKVNRDIPFNGLPWFFDHAETITPQNIERVRALGGGIAGPEPWELFGCILPATSIIPTSETFSFLLACWLAPWTEAVLTDYFVERQGRWRSEKF
jgi:hypothetical protein